MGWKLQIRFNDGTEEIVDETFDTYEDAEAEYDSWLENYGLGIEILGLSGEDVDDAEIVDYEIWEE